MLTISKIFEKYHNQIDSLDLELLISEVTKKPREFVLAHPEFALTKNQELKTKNLLARRARYEPIAYILGKKEFFGLDFRVNKDVLVPRPETELLVELALKELRTKNQGPRTIIDVGTGSGNIIISIAHSIKHNTWNNKLIGIDISSEALTVAKYNAKKNKADKKIKFLRGDLLEPIIQNSIRQLADKIPDTNYIIVANLPYLSKKIYASTARDVKNFEPKSALLSGTDGLDHYKKLFKQIKNTLYLIPTTCYVEISPEQKTALQKLVQSSLPDAKIKFMKDLAGKWRVCHISL